LRDAEARRAGRHDPQMHIASESPTVILSEREESTRGSRPAHDTLRAASETHHVRCASFFAFARNDSESSLRHDSSSVVGRTPALTLLLYAAPVTAIIAGVAAEWLDFRALRYPLLLMMLAAVAATHYAMEELARRRGESRTGFRSMLRAILLGMTTWAAAQAVYVVLHVAQGERFEAPRFGPQPLQALGLIAAHALFLGAPTGAVAGALLHGNRRARTWLQPRR
jgi:hypothetical protein